MKKSLVFIVLCNFFVIPACFGQANPVYDSVFAKKTGADEYGMKQYVLAFLKKGTVTISDPEKSKSLLQGHLQNIVRLANAGKLALAGPMMDDTGIEGIFILNVKTVAEAEALSQTDPAVKAGLFTMEFHPWYGSAALMEINALHKKLEKKTIF